MMNVSDEIDEPREPDSKRAKLRLQLKSGHDCIFTEELPQHLQVECSVCLCVLHDPHMIDCKCGASFCQSCIQPRLEEKRPCPMCNSPFFLSIPNLSLQRALSSLQVYCSFKEAGCEWVGELGGITEHLNDDNIIDLESDSSYKSSGCPFMQLKCCYCRQELQRQRVLEHELNECLKRPFKCDCCNEYESTFEDVTTKHVNVCPCGLVPCPNDCGVSLQRKCIDDHVTTNCPLEIVSCSFSYAGCEEKLPRKDMPAHISDSLAVHMSLQAISHNKQLDSFQAQIQEVKNEVEKLTAFVHTHLRIMPVRLLLNGFAAKKREKKRWWSEPFYTYPQGYKMVLSVDCNGSGEGAGSHLSLYSYVKRGEFDYQLKWPFRGTISIQLLNQESPEECHKEFLSFDKASERSSNRVTDGEHNNGWGFPHFIAHTELSKYLKNDSLCFRVLYITQQ